MYTIYNIHTGTYTHCIYVYIVFITIYDNIVHSEYSKIVKY